MRAWFSRLATEEARRAATRWALAACVAGAAITIALLAAAGRLDRWLFAVLAWGALVFMPAWLLITAAQGLGPRARAALAARVATDPARYQHAGSLRLTVERLADGALAMPRICLPVNRRQAIEAAIALINDARPRPPAATALVASIRRALVLATDEALHLSAAATGPAADNIQARWDSARALGAISALAAILVEVHRDQSGSPPGLPELAGREASGQLAALFDYADEAAMEVDAPPWSEPRLIGAEASLEQVVAAREAWHAFIRAGLPAPRALAAFVQSLRDIPLG
jgi:hypothetical protein